MAVSSSFNFNVGVFPSLVRSSAKVDLSAKIRLRPTPAAIFPSTPVVSLKLGSRRTARSLPVQAQAQHRCASESELVFYPHKFAQILTLLPTLPDVRTRCRQIERYSQNLPCLPTPFVTDSNRVEGLPMTYVHAFLDPINPSIVYFYAHSDAAHIRGLAVILIAGLSGASVQTVADMSLASAFELLIGQSLLPARWCSQFMLLLEHMQRKARELIAYTKSGNKQHVVEDRVLSVMGLEGLHIDLKDEIDKTRVVHQLFGEIDFGTDGAGDDVQADRDIC